MSLYFVKRDIKETEYILKFQLVLGKSVSGYFRNRYMTHMREFEDTKDCGSNKDIQYNRQEI